MLSTTSLFELEVLIEFEVLIDSLSFFSLRLSDALILVLSTTSLFELEVLIDSEVLILSLSTVDSLLASDAFVLAAALSTIYVETDPELLVDTLAALSDKDAYVLTASLRLSSAIVKSSLN